MNLSDCKISGINCTIAGMPLKDLSELRRLHQKETDMLWVTKGIRQIFDGEIVISKTPILIFRN